MSKTSTFKYLNLSRINLFFPINSTLLVIVRRRFLLEEIYKLKNNVYFLTFKNISRTSNITSQDCSSFKYETQFLLRDKCSMRAGM